MASASTDPATGSTAAASATTSAPSEAVSASEAEPRWRRCVPDVEPCTRPRPARWLLGGLGLGLAAAGAAYLLFVGDSLRAGDPGGYFGGGGMAALGGALLGGVFGLLGGDRRSDPDRLRPPTLGLDYSSGGAPRLDERHPGSVNLRFAPNYYFRDGGGRIRLFGNIGGLAGRAVETDPRPQNTTPLPDQTGTHPTALDERLLSVGLGVDLAVALPYPVLRRSARLGAAELRWRPEFQHRRHMMADGSTIERTMLLPLTVGVRWHISPRQRFTTYVGPRLDMIAYGSAGAGQERGGANLGPLHGEAWYDIDVPITRDPNARVKVISQITIGYLHSRFDGRGFNLGGAYGFLGPVYGGWQFRVRPRGSPVAFQGGAGVWIGSGFTAVFSAGAALPDLGGGRR
ncbi:MAG: hypothetical protein H6711_29115 [Myxococcales bacterium]|nr:hypothetical protein [Myxococcales bacterium]